MSHRRTHLGPSLPREGGDGLDLSLVVHVLDAEALDVALYTHMYTHPQAEVVI
jgi:hypothetical protein